MSKAVEFDAKELDKIIKKTRTGLAHIARNGLDPIIRNKLTELRNFILSELNSAIKASSTKTQSLEKDFIEMEFVEEVVIKDLGFTSASKAKPKDEANTNFTNRLAPIEKIKNAFDNSVESKNKDGILIFTKVPTSEYESVEQVYLKALRYFQESLYIDTTKGQPVYYSLTEKGKTALAVMQVKIRCSTLKGFDNPLTMKRFDSQKIRKDGFTTWAILKEDLDKLLDPSSGYSLNLSEPIEEIKLGNFEEAKELVAQSKDEKTIRRFEPIIETKEEQSSGLESAPYIELIQAIKNMQLVIEKHEIGANYILEYDLTISEVNLSYANLLSKIRQFIYIWIEGNSDLWYDAIRRKVERFVQDVNSNI